MTEPVPETTNAAYDVTEPPPGEHESELPGDGDGDQSAQDVQEENAGTSLDQPSH